MRGHAQPYGLLLVRTQLFACTQRTGPCRISDYWQPHVSSCGLTSCETLPVPVYMTCYIGARLLQGTLRTVADHPSSLKQGPGHASRRTPVSLNAEHSSCGWAALSAGSQRERVRTADSRAKLGGSRAAPCAPRTAWNSFAYSDRKRSRLPSSGSVRSTWARAALHSQTGLCFQNAEVRAGLCTGLVRVCCARHKASSRVLSSCAEHAMRPSA